MINRWVGIGRLTAKPELRYTSSNLAVTRFSLAVNRNFANENGETKADFINIIVWKKQAENVCNFLDKRSLVAIEGRIQTGSYEDRDGNKRYTTEVVADSVQFLESKKDSRPASENTAVTPEQAANSRNASPYDFQTNADVYSDFGNSVSMDDFLD